MSIATPLKKIKRLSIKRPGSWARLDLAALSDPDKLASLLGERFKSVTAWQSNAPAIGAKIANGVKQARRSGVVFAAMAATGSPAPFVATVLVALRLPTSPDEFADFDDAAQKLRTEFSANGRSEASVVDLPARKAVKVWSIAPEPAAIEDEMMILSVQYLVPLPEAGLVATIAFTSPSMALRDQLLELFDLMASTFEVEWADGVE